MIRLFLLLLLLLLFFIMFVCWCGLLLCLQNSIFTVAKFTLEAFNAYKCFCHHEWASVYVLIPSYSVLQYKYIRWCGTLFNFDMVRPSMEWNLRFYLNESSNVTLENFIFINILNELKNKRIFRRKNISLIRFIEGHCCVNDCFIRRFNTK